MKKVIFKIIASILSFMGALYLSSFIMNRGNVNTTKDMDKATLPVVYMNIGGEIVNELCGYTSEMDLGLLRENITPLDENRGVTFRIVKYGQNISGIHCQVRSVDGSRLIEDVEVTDYSEDEYNVLCNVNFKDLLEEYEEYSLQIYMTLRDNEEVFYHTRIIEADDYCIKEKLAFVDNFLEKEMSTETNSELSTYMESNYLGDNTTLQYVNIHSSLEQLAFGNLNVTRETEPVISVKELASETGMFLVDYIVNLQEGESSTKYFVEEYYRIKYTPDVTYLLDYERTMTEIPLHDSDMVRTEDLFLGITDSDLGLIESDDGNVIAFSDGGTLYSYNISENKLVRLFSFYDTDNFDARTYRRDYEVKPLSVDEAGNVWFAVSGYMNRGTYEGQVGVTLYCFNGVTSETEEQFFIESDKSAEIVLRDLDELCYLNKDGIFYVMLDKTIYAVNVEEKTVETLVSDLEEDKYSVSDDSSMMVWQIGDDVNSSESLKLMNLNTKQITEIKAPSGEYIKPLAFTGEDFIYGLAKKSDVVKDNTGRITFPMYTVKIQSKYGELLKEYSVDGFYVSQVSVKDNLITLDRVVKTEESETLSYTSVDSEYITNNQEQTELQNVVNVYTFGNYEAVVRILLKKEISGKVIKIVPKEVIYEGNKKLDFERAEITNNYYYVYYDGKLQKIYTSAANAVTEADENYGTVLNDKGYYVWYRANRYQRNQIMDLSPDSVTDEEKNKLADCLDRMMAYEGVVRNSEYLLNHGDTVLDILSEGLEEMDVLDLTGCTLDSVLYYVNRDIPVLALTNTEDTYLIIGFNQLAVVLFDPDTGWYKVGINEATELFENNGNQFITYVYNG